MARASWCILGVAVLVAGACANGTEDTDNASEAGGPVADASVAGPDGTSGFEEGGGRAEDSGGAPGDDAGLGAGEDSGSGEDGATGEDASLGEDGGGGDSGEPDSSQGGTDSGEIDAAHDSGTLDAGHDSGTAIDAGHDAGQDSGTVDAGNDSGASGTDAGHDSGGVSEDAGEDAGCAPPTTPAFAKTFHPPATSGTCTATQVSDFYSDCLAGTAGACSTWQGANASCNTCLTGSSTPTSTDWGPLIVYTVSQIDEIDLGACLYDDPSAGGTFSNITTCSKDLEYLMECEHAACDVSCSGASLGGYDACQTAADNSSSLCESEYNAVYGSGAACQNGVTSACFGGTDFESSFTAVAQVMCE